MPFLGLRTPTTASQSYSTGQLRIKAASESLDKETTVLTAKGGVEADYGEERVRADRIVIYLAPGEQKAVADGSVVLIDPDGSITADHMEFSWDPERRQAKVTHLVAHIVNTTVTAASADVTPKLWTFTNFSFTNDRNHPPIYVVSGKTLTFVPRKYVRIGKPTITILGHKIITWPAQRFNLDPRTTGFSPPTPVYHDGSVGFSWQAGRLIAPSTSLQWHWDAYRGELPGSGAQLTHSFVPADLTIASIVPSGELDQRFQRGYFESVVVNSPASELEYYSRPKSSITAFDDFNAAPTGRGVPNELFSFPVQAGYEVGGPLGSFGFLADFRVGSIQRVQGPGTVSRSEVEPALEFPAWRLSPKLSLISRTDAEFFQSSHSFGWDRLSSGLVYEPTKSVRLGAGLMSAVQWGTPDFDMDPLYFRDGAMLRADWSIGPRQVSVMSRYDTRLGWFDQEFVVTQAMGAFQAYFLYQRYPGDTRLGFTLRLEPLVDMLKRRHFDTP